jgi:hypothetical protein
MKLAHLVTPDELVEQIRISLKLWRKDKSHTKQHFREMDEYVNAILPMGRKKQEPILVAMAVLMAVDKVIQRKTAVTQ